MRRCFDGRFFAVCAATAMWVPTIGYTSALNVSASPASFSHATPSPAHDAPDDRPGAPVILLQGWHGSSVGGVGQSSLSVLARRLADDGHPVYWASGVGSDRAATVYDNAQLLGTIVADVARRHDGAGVALVAHSYGGLVARALVESDLYGDVLRRGGRVSSLVTLGTPMAGVDMWLPFVFVLGDPSSEPSVWELTPAFMHAFNQAHRPNPDVRYTLIAGDARSQSWILRVLPPSDGVVTVSSAHALCGRCYGLVELLTDDFHTPHTVAQGLGWHSYLDADTTYRDAIEPAVSGRTVSRRVASVSEQPVLPPATAIVHRPIEVDPAGFEPDELEPVDRGVESARGLPPSTGASARDFVPSVGVDARAQDFVPAVGVEAGRADEWTGGPAMAESLDVPPDDAFALRLEAETSAGTLMVRVHAASHAAGDAWAEILSPGGRRPVPLLADPLAAESASAWTLQTASVDLAPGYYLVRAGATARTGPLETETVVVVPYSESQRPARVLEVRVRGGTAHVVVDVKRAGRYVVSVAPADDAGANAQDGWGATVRDLQVGRRVLTVRLSGSGFGAAGTVPGDLRNAPIERVVRLFKADEGLMLADQAAVDESVSGR